MFKKYILVRLASKVEGLEKLVLLHEQGYFTGEGLKNGQPTDQMLLLFRRHAEEAVRLDESH